MPHISKYKKRSSDQSGFDGFEIGMVKQGPYKIFPDEFDNPPPSKKSLGGEGDVAQGEARIGADWLSISDTDTPATSDTPTTFITAAGGISPSFVHPFMRVSGSNAAITISANPQIVAGREKQILTLAGVGSNITISNGSGVALMGSAPLVIQSGVTVTFYYTTAGNVWWETSRNIGGF